MERVIISGASGFIGSLLVKKFYENGYEVVSLVKDKKEEIDPIKEYSTIIYSELHDVEYLIKCLKSDRNSAFYHLAWIGVNGTQKVDYNAQIQNIKMVCDCIKIAKESGCSRFMCAGTIAERAIESFAGIENIGAGMMYAVSKFSARIFTEMLCKNMGLDYIWMQFSNIYGPTNRTGNLVSYTLDQLEKNEDAIFGPAMQPYDFIYVSDLIEAIYKLGCMKQHLSNHYFIGSGEPRILRKYLEEIGRVVGKEQRIKIGIRPDDGIKYEMSMFDTAALKNEIGNYISMNFTEGIKYTVEHYSGGGEK